MKRILVISWFFPPVNSSEGVVTYKLLRKSKYNYDVFTQKKSDLWSYGNKDYLPEADNVNSVFARARTLEDWRKEAVQYFKDNMDKYDIVMTRSMPEESHMIGLEIKKINPKIKWIASFGDPIANNPYTKLSLKAYNPYSLRSYYRLKFRNIISPRRIIKNAAFKIRCKRIDHRYFYKNGKLQDEVVKNADYIILNSEYQKNYMLGKYSKNITDRAVILNHSFAEDLYPAKTEKGNSDKFVMTYVGHLDTLRTPKLLFEAINELYEENSNLAEKVEFRFYGDMADSDKVYIKVKKPVSYLESLKVMKDSDWLLQIDANITECINKNIFFAAKLADYIGSGNRIFGITMSDGISADILRNMNALVTTYSVSEIKNYLWLIIYKGYDFNINKEYTDNFNSKNVARLFDELVEKMI